MEEKIKKQKHWKIPALILTCAIVFSSMLITSAVSPAFIQTLTTSFGQVTATNPTPIPTPTATPPPANTYTYSVFIRSALFNSMQGALGEGAQSVSFPDSNVTVGQDYKLIVTVRNIGNGSAVFNLNSIVISGEGTTSSNPVLRFTPDWEEVTLAPYTTNDFTWNVHVGTAGIAMPVVTITPSSPSL